MKKYGILLICCLSAILSIAQEMEKPFKKAVAHERDIIFLGNSPDWKYIVSGSRDNTIKLWQTDSLAEARTFKGHISAINVVTFSLDMKYMLSGSDDGEVILWDATSGAVLQKVHNHTGAVNGVAFSQDATGHFFYSGGEDGNIQVYDRLTNNKFVNSIKAEGNGVQGLGIAPGSRNITIICTDGKMREYDPQGAILRTFEGSHSEEVRQLVFSADGKHAASCSDDKTIILWDLAAGKADKILEGHEWKVFGINFNPTGEFLASASIDGTVRMWDIRSGQEVKKWTTKNRKSFIGAVFTPDSKYVISAMQHTPPLNLDFYWWETGKEMPVPPVIKSIPDAPVSSPAAAKPVQKPKPHK